MSNIETIPEIPKLTKRLKQDILSGKMIIFIGSGLSKLLGLSSWKELAENRLKKILKDKKISYEIYLHLRKENPLKVLSICESFLDKEDWHNSLYKSNYNEEEAKKIMSLLSPFDFGFVTTNYDNLLELIPIINSSKLATQSNRPESIVESSRVQEEINFEIFMREPRHKVYYLHGKELSKDNPPVCTLNDYLRHYRRDGRGRNTLEKLCAKKSLLFIGVGLQEFEILEHLHMSRYENQHYALIPMFSYENRILEQYKAYYRTLNIEILPYNISNNGYEQLIHVLECWSKRLLKEKTNSKGKVLRRLKNNKLIDEVAHGLE